MQRSRLFFVSLALLASVGCFQGQRTFKVNADGSGTIVDTTKLGAQAQAMVLGLSQMDSGSAADKKAKQEAKLAETAAAMGEGVTFVSSTTGPDGADVTTYAFKDITKVKASGMPSPKDATSKNEEPVTFKLAKNAAGNMVLTVVSGNEKKADAASAPSAPRSPEEVQQGIAMMKGMLAGLKIRSVVEVNGTLVKTDSPHAEGARVTLMDLDFDALDEAALAKLSESGPEGPPSPAMLKGIKGIKVSDPVVTIEFKGAR